MKSCPICKRTYSDDTLSFCLDDGSVLVTGNEAQEIPTVISRIPTRRRAFKFYLFVVAGVLGLTTIVGISIWKTFFSNSQSSEQIKKVTMEKYNPHKGSVNELLPESVNISASGGRPSREIFNFKEKLPADERKDKAQKDTGFIDGVQAIYESSIGQEQVELTIVNFNSGKEAIDNVLKIAEQRKLPVGEKYKDDKNVGKRVTESKGNLWSNGSLMIFIERKSGKPDLADFELNLPF